VRNVLVLLALIGGCGRVGFDRGTSDGGFTRTSLGTLVDHGVVQLQTGDRIALLPITFHFSRNTCGTGQIFYCADPEPVLDASDPLVTCALAP
jgi:hypothetical protein